MNVETAHKKQASNQRVPFIFGEMTDIAAAAAEYAVDTVQRSILFVDILRRQGNQYFYHLDTGLKPVLSFDYDVIMDGRHFEKPVNYQLVKIIDKRRRRDSYSGLTGERRRRPNVSRPDNPSTSIRPIVIVDPRAGQGPGIGGSKQDSEIGVALDNGHPVYYIVFTAYPEPGQTLSDVKDAEILFLKEVIRRHPKADKPAVIGNCQAGWAVAMLCAERPDLVGTAVLNGAPLSYWAGKDGKNPMRYKGGLTGGIWMTSLWSDLGNGLFDGASLVAGFEDLNPANTLCGKPYHLYSNIDTEEERYLHFEKWWNGYFYMTADEIHFIVENLFLGNKLENGGIEFQPGKPVNLRNIDGPIIVFASDGDNITPPQQALNWILKIWSSVEEIKREQQVIVYLLHESIGHLGIFVSGNVARKQHREIISTINMVDYLAPGLYEMIIDEPLEASVLDNNKVRFEERYFADLLNLDDGFDDELDFFPVAQISDFNDKLYKTTLGPWVKMLSNDFTAQIIRLLHPLRLPRYVFSDMNLLLLPIALLAPVVKSSREPAMETNPFRLLEKNVVENLAIGLDYYRDMRDFFQEFCFKSLYSNSFMHIAAKEYREARRETRHHIRNAEQLDAWSAAEDEYWKDAINDGGFVEGVIRIMVSIAQVDGSFDRDEYQVSARLVRDHDRLSAIHPAVFKRLVRKQARVLHHDWATAIEALPVLIRTQKDRMEAVEIAKAIAGADAVVAAEEAALLNRIAELLGVGIDG